MGVHCEWRRDGLWISWARRVSNAWPQQMPVEGAAAASGRVALGAKGSVVADKHRASWPDLVVPLGAGERAAVGVDARRGGGRREGATGETKQRATIHASATGTPEDGEAAEGGCRSAMRERTRRLGGGTFLPGLG